MLIIKNSTCPEMMKLETWYDLVEEHRSSDRFNYAQPFTDHELMGEITDKINPSKDAKIGVMFTVEWAMYLERAGFCDITLITDKYDRVVSTYANKLIGCDYLTLDQIQEKNMKFNIIVGNPPFSKTNPGKTAGKKGVNLYPFFYQRMLELADIVCMIMPETSNQSSGLHNETIKSSAHFIKHITPEEFPGPGIKMWTVYYDKNKPSDVDNFFANFTESNTIAFKKGSVNLSTIKDQVSEVESTDTIRVVKAVYQSTGVESVFANSSAIKKEYILPKIGHVVLIPLTLPESGWRIEVEPCNGQAVNVNVTYILTSSLDEAIGIQNKLMSQEFIQAALSKRGNQCVMTQKALKSVTI